MIGVSDGFHSAAFGQIIKPILRLYISFDKQISEGDFFTLGESELDGPDILKFSASDADTQSWDFYNYIDYSDRLVSVSWERRLEFPYTIQIGMADFTLSNTDGYFIPLSPKSPIGQSNLPARPIRIGAGFSYQGAIEIVPQLSGITDGLPDLHDGSKTVDYHVIDFLYQICQSNLQAKIVMRDARTDLVIAAILDSYGLSPSQYRLDPANFKIPFVFFDIGDNIGDALKKLVQSENGFMWLDEEGIVRFSASASGGGNSEIIANLSDYEILSLTQGALNNVVNHVKITAEVREVQEWQEVYTKSSSSTTVSDSLWVVPAGGDMTMVCGLGDPCYDMVAPTLGAASSVSWFTCMDQNGNEVRTGVTATGDLSSKAYTVSFHNNNTYDVEIDEMKLWGEPAKVYDVLDYDAYDDVSVEKYGDQLLEVTDNQFFQTYMQANMFARTTILQHSDYTRTVEAEIKGDFSFQLLDLIKITTTSGEYDDIYRVMGSSYSWDGRQLITKLALMGNDVEEGVFTLNLSKLNGEDLLV